MTGWLLDTTVLSELRRPRPAPQVAAFVAGQPLDLLFVSTVTLAEIRFGIELVADANRRAELNAWLTRKLRPMFDERILPVTEDILFTWLGGFWSKRAARLAIRFRSPTSSLPQRGCIMA